VLEEWSPGKQTAASARSSYSAWAASGAGRSVAGACQPQAFSGWQRPATFERRGTGISVSTSTRQSIPGRDNAHAHKRHPVQCRSVDPNDNSRLGRLLADAVRRLVQFEQGQGVPAGDVDQNALGNRAGWIFVAASGVAMAFVGSWMARSSPSGPAGTHQIALPISVHHSANVRQVEVFRPGRTIRSCNAFDLDTQRQSASGMLRKGGFNSPTEQVLVEMMSVCRQLFAAPRCRPSA